MSRPTYWKFRWNCRSNGGNHRRTPSQQGLGFLETEQQTLDVCVVSLIEMLLSDFADPHDLIKPDVHHQYINAPGLLLDGRTQCV
jgi:hypothetical protein